MSENRGGSEARGMGKNRGGSEAEGMSKNRGGSEAQLLCVRFRLRGLALASIVGVQRSYSHRLSSDY